MTDFPLSQAEDARNSNALARAEYLKTLEVSKEALIREQALRDAKIKSEKLAQASFEKERDEMSQESRQFYKPM